MLHTYLVKLLYNKRIGKAFRFHKGVQKIVVAGVSFKNIYPGSRQEVDIKESFSFQCQKFA